MQKKHSDVLQGRVPLLIGRCDRTKSCVFVEMLQQEHIWMRMCQKYVTHTNGKCPKYACVVSRSSSASTGALLWFAALPLRWHDTRIFVTILINIAILSCMCVMTHSIGHLWQISFTWCFALPCSVTRERKWVSFILVLCYVYRSLLTYLLYISSLEPRIDYQPLESGISMGTRHDEQPLESSGSQHPPHPQNPQQSQQSRQPQEPQPHAAPCSSAVVGDALCAITVPTPTAVHLQNLEENQRTLVDMGFLDERENLLVLAKFGNDLNQTLDEFKRRSDESKRLSFFRELRPNHDCEQQQQQRVAPKVHSQNTGKAVGNKEAASSVAASSKSATPKKLSSKANGSSVIPFDQTLVIKQVPKDNKRKIVEALR